MEAGNKCVDCLGEAEANSAKRVLNHNKSGNGFVVVVFFLIL